MWKIVSIDEADFGCEERLPGEPLLVIVTIENDNGERAAFEVADNWLTVQGLDEGDEWPEDIEKLNADAEQVEHMNDWMENYYNAIEELEDK